MSMTFETEQGFLYPGGPNPLDTKEPYIGIDD